VPQDSVVFAATARDNIRFGRPIDGCRGERAADLAHAPISAPLPGGFRNPSSASAA